MSEEKNDLREMIDSDGRLTDIGINYVRKQVSELIKEAREDTHFTCGGMAEITGLTRPTALNIESGKEGYTIDNLIKYLSGINCSIQIVKNK